MNAIPTYISAGFIFITLATVLLFFKATHNHIRFLMGIGLWLLLQALLGYNGFYIHINQHPQKFVLLVAPAMLFIAGLFISPSGRSFLNTFDIKTLTLLHTIRVGVELILLGLSINKTVPQLMTFEGRNFDIFSGLSAPIIYYLYFIKKSIGKHIFIAWNVICIGLLINIVVNAVLSLPTSFQQFAFEQPNIAVLYFPYVWLPSCVVPLVLLSHLVSIKQLLWKQS